MPKAPKLRRANYVRREILTGNKREFDVGCQWNDVEGTYDTDGSTWQGISSVRVRGVARVTIASSIGKQ
jgi:hypothetical protein